MQQQHPYNNEPKVIALAVPAENKSIWTAFVVECIAVLAFTAILANVL